MSSRKYAAPLRLQPEPSRLLRRLLGLALAGGAVLPLTVPMPWYARLLAWCALAAVGRHAWQKHLGTQRIREAVWDEQGLWHLRAGDAAWEAQLDGDSVVTPELVILNFRAERRRDHLVLPGDSLDAESLRRLRVRLRLEGRREAAAAAKDVPQAAADGRPRPPSERRDGQL